MSMTDDGGPAFPHPGGSSDGTVQESYLGMSLRDFFAAAVLQGMLAVGRRPIAHEDDAEKTQDQLMAENSYLMADYMLAARQKGAQP